MTKLPKPHVEVRVTVLAELLEKYELGGDISIRDLSAYQDKLIQGAGAPSSHLMRRFKENLSEVGGFLKINGCDVSYSGPGIISGRSVLRGARCKYCHGPVRVSVAASLRRVRCYEVPPVGASDLRKTMYDRWMIQYVESRGECVGQCGRAFSARSDELYRAFESDWATE